MTKNNFKHFYIELRRKIAKRYGERKKTDLSNTLKMDVTIECVSEFLNNPPSCLGWDRQYLLMLLSLTAESYKDFHNIRRRFGLFSCLIISMVAICLVLVGNGGLASVIASCFMAVLSVLFIVTSLLGALRSKWDVYIDVVAENFETLTEEEEPSN